MMGQISTQPMDVIKIRMQVSQTGLQNTIVQTLKTDGIRGFYIGMTAAILRQLTYSTTRLGAYNVLLDLAERQFGRLNYATMVSFGMVAGMMGSFVGTPADVIFIRMVADINLPREKRRYTNAISGIIDIWRTEGLFRLWRGAVPTMGRAAVVNGTLLGTYTRTKMLLQDIGLIKEGMLMQFCAAMLSSVVTCCVSIPVDAAKTRIQNWREAKKPPGLISMMLSIAKTEGVLSLWRGFLPYYGRAGPNTIITMVCLDQLQRLYQKSFQLT